MAMMRHGRNVMPSMNIITATRTSMGTRTTTMLKKIQVWQYYNQSRLYVASRLLQDCRRSYYTLSSRHRTHLIFGANTDVGKTVVSTGLVQASLKDKSVHYVKPLQSGGNDAGFVQKYNNNNNNQRLKCTTLYKWQTPASPHYASMIEETPLKDVDLYQRLQETIQDYKSSNDSNNTVTYIETAGGPLSPAAASPDNNVGSQHASSQHDASSWRWQTQADLYQPLLGIAPVVLVGDGRLGGIHATLSTLESLLVRGYDIAAIVVIETDQENINIEAIKDYLHRKASLRTGSGDLLFGNDIGASIVSLPAIPSDINIPLVDWFADDLVQTRLQSLDQHLQSSWEGYVQDLRALKTTGRQVLWWPFTQHGQIESDHQVNLIDSAHGDYYRILLEKDKKKSTFGKENNENSNTIDDNNSTDIGNKQQQQSSSSSTLPDLVSTPMFDACASWWTQGVGHGQSNMALAVAAAAGRYGHVIFPNVVHAPAVQLAQTLLDGPGNGWADRVFWSDDGSTAVEVAIKMGIKTYQKRVNAANDPACANLEWVVLGQADCYHGDTLGVMDVAEPSIFNEGQHAWYDCKALILSTPTLGFDNGKLRITFPEGSEPTTDTVTEFDSIDQVMDVNARMISRKLYSQYKELIDMQWLVYEHSQYNRKIASVVIEPVLLGAGGMKFVDPLWQRALMDVAEMRNVPVIFDEVASGLYRVGVVSCREILQKDPDIACYAKLLTGGLLPMSVTLATEEVFETFLGDEKGQALLHGHSYTANPVGCAAALHALETYRSYFENDEAQRRRASPRMWFDEDQVKNLSMLPLVKQSFTLGTVLAVTIEPEDGEGGYGASSRTVPIVQKLRDSGVFARPLGNVVYIMVSPITSKDECQRLTAILENIIVDFSKEITS